MMRAVIAIVVVLVVVAGIVVLQNRGGDQPVDPHPAVVSNQIMTPQNPANPDSLEIVHPETHVIDLHDPVYWEPEHKDEFGNVVTVLEKGQVSEGELVTFLHSPKWLKKCPLNSNEDENEKLKSTAGKVPGLAIYNFEVKREADYFVYLSAKWTDTCGNSCWILMNGPEKGGHGPEGNNYHKIEDQEGFITEKDYKTAWHPLKKENQPLPFHLKPGMNRVELHTREDGPTFYQLVITTEANTPVGGRIKHKS